MGNHTAGNYINLAATIMAERRREGETALSILDDAVALAKEQYDFSSDAEFDDARDTDQPLGKLIFEAFAPNGVADIPRYDELNCGGDETEAGEVEFDALFDATYGAFRKRYDLC